MALSKIQAESMNLADTYAFTGTVSGASDYVKITETVLDSDASSVSFTSSGSPNIFSSDYRKLHFYFSNWKGSGTTTDSSNLKFNVSIDDGANYNVAKTSCFTQAYHNASGAGGAISYETSYDSAGSTGDINLLAIIGSNTDKSNGLMMTLEQPYSTSSWKSYSCFTSVITGGAVSNTYNYSTITTGNIQTTSALSGIKFTIVSNALGTGIDIKSGAILSVYGVK
jgi:hypothetical protein